MTSDECLDIEEYLENHNNCGLRVGDIVRISRIAEYGEEGWGNGWADEMDDMVGEVYVISHDDGAIGFRLGGFFFPWFVLEPVHASYEVLCLHGLKFCCRQHARQYCEGNNRTYCGTKKGPARRGDICHFCGEPI